MKPIKDIEIHSKSKNPATKLQMTATFKGLLKFSNLIVSILIPSNSFIFKGEKLLNI